MHAIRTLSAGVHRSRTHFRLLVEDVMLRAGDQAGSLHASYGDEGEGRGEVGVGSDRYNLQRKVNVCLERHTHSQFRPQNGLRKVVRSEPISLRRLTIYRAVHPSPEVPLALRSRESGTYRSQSDIDPLPPKLPSNPHRPLLHQFAVEARSSAEQRWELRHEVRISRSSSYMSQSLARDVR
jgi:hypothetical protein